MEADRTDWAAFHKRWRPVAVRLKWFAIALATTGLTLMAWRLARFGVGSAGAFIFAAGVIALVAGAIYFPAMLLEQFLERRKAWLVANSPPRKKRRPFHLSGF